MVWDLQKVVLWRPCSSNRRTYPWTYQEQPTIGKYIIKQCYIKHKSRTSTHHHGIIPTPILLHRRTMTPWSGDKIRTSYSLELSVILRPLSPTSVPPLTLTRLHRTLRPFSSAHCNLYHSLSAPSLPPSYSKRNLMLFRTSFLSSR